jgi:hypothetical protein
MKNFLLLLFLAIGTITHAQVAINNNGSLPDSSAMLDVKSGEKGILVPRMSSAKRDAIVNPANGLLIYCTNDNSFYVNRGTSSSPDWVSMNSYWATNGTDIYYIGDKVGIGTMNPTAKLDIRGSNPDDGIIFQVGNSDLSHRLIFFGGRVNDPNPFIQWKQGDPLRFTTDEGGWSEKMRITSDGRVGIGTDNPGAALEVSSTTQGFLPPRMGQAQIDALTPALGLMVFNTTTFKPNYYDGAQWRNFDGTLAFGIGISCLGGVIAYILQNGDPGYDPDITRGLITTPANLSMETEWGCNGTEIPGADGAAIGTGRQNTVDIVAGCATAGIAAKLCADYSVNGYNDWYLPCQDELYRLYLNKVAIGGFPNNYYWSSTEVDNNNAVRLYIANGVIANSNKYAFNSVRCIRAF